MRAHTHPTPHGTSRLYHVITHTAQPGLGVQVTSSAKKRRKPGSLKISQTPDGSFYDLQVRPWRQAAPAAQVDTPMQPHT